MIAVLQPTGPGVHIVIDRAVVLVGRSADCDAIIDVSSKISRMHCVLVQVDADYYIRDLGSMNGVLVNGKRVEKTAKLVHGVEVSIGDVVFKFHTNVQPPTRVAVRSQGGTKVVPALVDKAVPILDAEIIDAQILDDADLLEEVGIVDVIEDVENVDDFIQVLDFADEIDVIEDVEVIEDVQVIDDIEVLDDIEVINDVPIVTNEVRRPRRPPRLR